MTAPLRAQAAEQASDAPSGMPATTPFDPHPNLADLIEQFHRAHPDFVTALPCIDPAAVTLPVVPRGTLIASARLGITVAEYRRRQAAGERWCSWGQHLVPDWFVDGKRTHAYCPSCRRAYQRDAAGLRRQRRSVS